MTTATKPNTKIVTAISGNFVDWLAQNGYRKEWEEIQSLQAEYRKDRKPSSTAYYWERMPTDKLIISRDKYTKVLSRINAELARR